MGVAVLGFLVGWGQAQRVAFEKVTTKARERMWGEGEKRQSQIQKTWGPGPEPSIRTSTGLPRDALWLRSTNTATRSIPAISSLRLDG